MGQCTVREEDGKLVSETDRFTSVREIQGDEMIEVSHIHQEDRFSVNHLCFVPSDDHCWFCDLHQQKQTGLTRTERLMTKSPRGNDLMPFHET